MLGHLLVLLVLLEHTLLQVLDHAVLVLQVPIQRLVLHRVRHVPQEHILPLLDLSRALPVLPVVMLRPQVLLRAHFVLQVTTHPLPVQ